MKKLISLMIIAALFAAQFTGCKKTDNAPTIPPSKSMTIDFSAFTAAKKSVDINAQAQVPGVVNNVNWLLASTTAGFWNIILTVNLVVPVTAFKAAIDNKPALIGDKKWEWKYTANVVGAAYNARLTGEIRATDVKWEMYISKDGAGAFAEFLWFSGTSALDGKSGQWILNCSPVFNEPYLQIDWTITGLDIGSVKYTYIRDLKDNRTPDLFKTSYIEYGLKSQAMNAYYNIHYNSSATISDFKDVFIEWSTTTYTGHIKAVHYYQDSNWHCWNGSGLDVVCN
jgi:hypothetical protein